ncbi:YdaS family helix-turn-helix protein [Brucella sp. TWI559]
MNLADWRKSEKLSCEELARRLGITVSRGGTNVWNWESGRTRADADVIDRIEKLTGGHVTPLDMHRTRLSWLRRNKSVSGEAA